MYHGTIRSPDAKWTTSRSRTMQRSLLQAVDTVYSFAMDDAKGDDEEDDEAADDDQVMNEVCYCRVLCQTYFSILIG